jgi:F-type H+-transporting ATPase subunit b
MLVDWFTTAAQIVNFLILVWLLKRFLYKPILRAMDEREKRMSNALQKAEQEKATATSERLAFEKKSQELAQNQDQILKTIAAQGEQERQKMVSVAREEVIALEARWREAMNQERISVFQELSTRIQNEIFGVSRQVLSDLAGASLEASMADRFIQQLKLLKPSEKSKLTTSLGSSSSAVTITSTFELPDNGKRQIESAVEHEFGLPVKIRFTTDPQNIGGIELSANGHKVSWTIQSYLSSLERDAIQISQTSELTHGQPV